MSTCPICRASSDIKKPGTPYFVCGVCDLWWQDPLPKKLLHGPHEAAPDAMGEGEKQANEALAGWLFEHAMGGKPGLCADVGSAYPWLMHTLKQKYECTCLGIEPGEGAAQWHRQLGVHHAPHDFEEWAPPVQGVYRLVTFVHSFEHQYRPLDALLKVRKLLADDGVLFIRCPDHRIRGIERDFSEGHYQIHPYIWTFTAFLQALAVTDTFQLIENLPLMPGQRDLIFRPL